MRLELDTARFTVKLGDKLAVTPCLEFVLYLDVTEDRALLEFYQRCRDALGGLLTNYQAESMKSYAKLNERGDSLVPTWFSRPRAGKIDYFIDFGGCDFNVETCAASLLMRVMRWPAAESEQQLAKMRAAQAAGRRVPFYPTSDLRLTLPLDHPLADPQKLRDWVLEFELLQGATGFSGFVGYALNYMEVVSDSDLKERSLQALASLCRRFPGFGMAGGAVASKIFRWRPERGDLLPRIKRANWLTLLCDRTVEAVGGADSLRSALGSDLPIEVGRLPHGLWIQAGPVPRHGDLAQRDFIPPYRRLAKALRAVRIEELNLLSSPQHVEADEEWLNAFDVEYD